MDQRIRDFEPLWNARLIPLEFLERPALVRSTCEHWLLPEAELERWFAAPTVQERDAILEANRTPHRFSWNDQAPDQDLEPQACWLQRTTGQDNATQEFEPAQEVYRGPAPLIAPLLTENPLDYYDPDADDIYDLDYAAY
jgi:hypothetical protein